MLDKRIEKDWIGRALAFLLRLRSPRWLAIFLLAVMIVMVTAGALIACTGNQSGPNADEQAPGQAATEEGLGSQPVQVRLPSIDWSAADHLTGNPAGIPRRLEMTTTIPSRPRVNVTTYVVQPGDNLFVIAEKFGLKPESVLWGNYEVLRDNPQLLSPGQELNILPVEQYLNKGQTVFIEGRLQTRHWDDNEGNKHTSVEVVANEMIMLSERRENEESPASDISDEEEFPF